MMLKNKIIGLCIILTLVQMVQAQTYRSNFDITAGGGMHSAMLSSDNAGDYDKKFGWTFNFNYRLMFCKHVGIGTGVGLSYYKVTSNYDSLLISNTVLDEEIDQEYEYKTTLKNWSADQNMLNLEVPIALYLQCPMGKNWSFLANVGAKMMIPLWNENKTLEGSYETTGYFDDTNIEYADLPQHGFSKHSYYCSTADFKSVIGAGFVDLGLLRNLGNDARFYFGVYASTTFTDLIKKDETKSTSNKDYVKMLTSDNLTDARLIAAGVKIGFSFGRPRYVERNPLVMDLASADSVAPASAKVMTLPNATKNTAVSKSQQQYKPGTVMRNTQSKMYVSKDNKERDGAKAMNTALPKQSTQNSRVQSALAWLNANMSFSVVKSQIKFVGNNEISKNFAILVDYIKTNPTKKVAVAGYAMGAAKEEDNIEQGYNYADVLKDALIKAGIPSSNISVQSTGSMRPAVSNAAGQKQQRNKGAEISIE